MTDNIVQRISDELAISYEGSGRKVPESVTIIAASLQDAIGFPDAETVHIIFSKARDIEAIPTQKTLKECWRNYQEEVLKYRKAPEGTKAIGHDSARSAWLPAEDFKRRINLQTAIKNYCEARDDGSYYQYIRCHGTKEAAGGDRKRWEYINPGRVEEFDGPIKEYLRYLYRKYWRELPIAQGYPADAPLNLGLIPPMVDEFKVMIRAEGSYPTETGKGNAVDEDVDF